MKTVLSVVLVLVFAGVTSAQPPRDGHGKFGMGRGQFGDPAHMAQMARLWHDQKPEGAKAPGPPPWSGKGMRMGGQRGPQPPFLGQPSKDFGPKNGADLRRGGKNNKVPGYNPNCGWRGWEFGNSVGPHKGRSSKSGKLEGSNKSITIIIKLW